MHSPLVRRLCLELPAEAGDPRGPVPHEIQQRIPQLLPVSGEEDQQVAVSRTSAHLLLQLQGDYGSGIELNTLYVNFTLFARELWAVVRWAGFPCGFPGWWMSSARQEDPLDVIHAFRKHLWDYGSEFQKQN